MFQSNFQLLQKKNPSIAPKRKQPTADQPLQPTTSYSNNNNNNKNFNNNKKFRPAQQTPAAQDTSSSSTSSSSSSTLNEILKLSQLAHIDEKSARGGKITPTAPVTTTTTTTIPRHKLLNNKPILSEQEHRRWRQALQLAKSNEDEWFYTSKRGIFVPPLYDPVVITYQYGYGARQTQLVDSLLHVQKDVEYEHVLLRVTIVTKFGHIIYDHLVKPVQKITDYRCEITHLNANDFHTSIGLDGSLLTTSKTKLSINTIDNISRDIADILDNRIVIGYNLTLNTNAPEFQALRQLKLNKQHRYELERDLEILTRSRQKTSLFGLLAYTHPTFLLRDVAHYITTLHTTNMLDVIANQAQKRHDGGVSKPIMTTSKSSSKSSTSSLTTTSTTTTNQQDITKLSISEIIAKYLQPNNVNTLYLALPLTEHGISALSQYDIYLQQAFQLLQMYLQWKEQWEKYWKNIAGKSISSYKQRITMIMKQIEQAKIEEQKSIDAKLQKKIKKHQKDRARQERKIQHDDRWGSVTTSRDHSDDDDDECDNDLEDYSD